MRAKELKVEGEVIPKEVVSAVIRRMKSKKGFRAADLRSVAEKQMEKARVGLKRDRPIIAMRLSDRLTQKARKDGCIVRGTEAGKFRDWSWAA